jgi:hypothetical protein
VVSQLADNTVRGRLAESNGFKTPAACGKHIASI